MTLLIKPATVGIPNGHAIAAGGKAIAHVRIHWARGLPRDHILEGALTKLIPRNPFAPNNRSTTAVNAMFHLHHAHVVLSRQFA